MNMPSRHISQQTLRRLIASGLAIVYLAFVFTPLVSSAIYSPTASPAQIRVCAGNCDICGCSPESRASQSCCCAKKRQQQAHVHEDDGDETADCCKKKPVEKKTILACGCPCGEGKQFPFSIVGTSEVILCKFSEQFSLQHTLTRFPFLSQLLASRHREPPDPPPKLV